MGKLRRNEEVVTAKRYGVSFGGDKCCEIDCDGYTTL